MSNWTRWCGGILAGCAFIGFAATDAMAAYPDHPIRFLVGTAAGGGTDALARIVGAKLAEKWGQPVLVENREGASNTIAEDLAAHAPPDGYTIVMVNGNHTITPSQLKLNYDPVKSFAPISLLVTQPDVLVINPNKLPVKSVKELIAYAKSKPGQLNFATGGVGSPPHLEMALFMSQTGTSMVNLSYKGTALSLVAVLNGEAEMMFGSVTTTIEQVKAGKLKALAVSTKGRSPAMPDIPSISEAADLPDFDVGSWFGILAPAGTPKDVVAKLHDGVVDVMKLPDVQKTMRDQGIVTIADTPEEFTTFIKDDIPRWAAVIKTINAK